MPDIDSNAYRVLKKLSKVENGRGFPKSDTYWFSYLCKRGLSRPSSIKISEHEILGVEIITEQGRSFIKDHRKETIKSWVLLIAAITGAIFGLIALLLK